jgi:hypothetical protein
VNRRVPPYFPAVNESNAERRIYAMFGEDEGCRNMVLIHSLFLSAHLKRSFGEIDFIALAPGEGVFLLEVKGGGIRREDGVWYTTDRNGDEHRLAKGPVEQLKDTMFSLQEWLGNVLENDRIRKRLKPEEIEALKKLRFGYGLMLPSNDELPIDDPAWEPWMLFLRPDLRRARPIGSFVERLSKGFRDKPIWAHPGAIPDARICAVLEKVLIGDFEVRYELISRLQDDGQVIDELTREQLDVLANTRCNDRCFFQGGAGTGKTVLAVELFAEQVKAGRRTALFCFNRLLADHLRQRVKALDPAIDLDRHHIGTLDAFMRQAVGAEVPTDPEERARFFKDLPYALLDLPDNTIQRFRYDNIIVDEAQDILSEERLMVIDVLLADGLKNGKWTFFGDLNRQLIYRDHEAIEQAIAVLRRNTGCYMSPPLAINCRNTQRIARNVTKHTGGSEPRFRDGTPNGEPVDFHFPATPTLRRGKIQEILAELAQQRIPAKDVVILSTMREALDELAGEPEVATQMGTGLRLHTIHEFKGLESPVVILTGFRSLLQESDQQLLYVGMSRARTKLYLVLGQDLRLERDVLLERNRLANTN